MIAASIGIARSEAGSDGYSLSLRHDLSLMLTCRARGIEPLAWLRYTLTELPQRAVDTGLDDLLPFNFLKTSDT